MRFQAASRTDVGRVRRRNEDSLGFFKPTDSALLKRYGICLAVADGVGGEAHGDIASRTAIATLLKEYYKGPADVPVQQRLRDGVAKTNMAVLQASDELRSHGMATTLVAAVILADRAVIANVGDSRAYVINRSKVTARQISLDHSLVQEQVRMGILTPEEAEKAPNKNVITRALGTDPAVKVDVFEVPLIPGDTVLLCSDGLVRVVSDAEIAKIVASNPLATAVDKLVALANSRGGPDNISVCAAGAASRAASKVVPVAVVAVVAILAVVALVLGRGQLGKVFDLLGRSSQANLAVTSSPPGAQIYLDDVDTNQTTPWTFTVKPGTHTIRFTRAGYDDHTETLDLQARAEKTVSVNLVHSNVASSTTTILTINSTPPGAQASLDGKSIGTTPIINKQVNAGKQRVLVLKFTDYDDYTETLDLKAGGEQTMSVPLTKKSVTRTTATLTVTSTPPGAQVYLDGTSIGTTPLTKNDVTPSSHTLRLTLTGYDAYIMNITLQAGVPRTVVAFLTKTPPAAPTTAATLTVTSEPSGAEVYLDGKDTGKMTPSTFAVAIGTHAVKVTKDGYDAYQDSVALAQAGMTKTLPVTLIKTPATPTTATLTITSTPPEAKVSVDGISKGKTPLTISVEAGTRVLRVTKATKDGFLGFEITETILAGQNRAIAADLAQPPPGTTLSVSMPDSDEPIQILLDGTEVDFVVTDYPIAPGKYDLTVRKGGRIVYNKPIDVNEGPNSVVVSAFTKSDGNGLQPGMPRSYVYSLRSLFAIEATSAATGFSFSKSVSLVDQQLVPSGLPLNLSIRFHGAIALSANCEVTTTSGTAPISQGDIRDCTVGIGSFPTTASLTIGIDVDGQDLSKTVSATQASPFGGELQFPAVNLTYPTLGNPTLTISPKLSLGNSSLRMRVGTDGALSVTPAALEYSGTAGKVIKVSSLGVGNSSVSLTDATLTLDSDALVLGGELSVDIPLVGTRSIDIGAVTLPFTVQAQLTGSPAKLTIATFSTAIPGGTTSVPAPPSSGGNRQGIAWSRPIIALLAVATAAVISLAGVLATKSRTTSSPTSEITLSLPKGVLTLKPTEGVIALGRGSENRIRLKDAKASRRHALIRFTDGRWWIEDAGSTNGTRVNGVKIGGSTALEEGDVIEVGADRITVGKNT